MPITSDGRYICDPCGAEIEDQRSGTFCPICSRIFCLECNADNPIVKVEVNKKGPDYKRYEYMCRECEEIFLRMRGPETKQVKLSAF